MLTVPQSPRRGSFEASWRSHVPIPGLTFDFRWVGVSAENSTSLRHLTPPQHLVDDVHTNCGATCWSAASMDLTVKDTFAFNYHAEESTADWMMRSGDDLMINYALLSGYFRALSGQYDPAADVVIRSNCIDFYGTLYPQGGVGAVFSRAASKKLANGHRTMLERWRESEDISLGGYISERALPMWMTDDGHMMGLGWESVEKLEEELAMGLQECPPPVVGARDCRRGFVSPLSELVFFHAQGHTDDELRVAQRLFAMNRSVMWYSGPDWRPKVCVKGRGGMEN